MVSSTFSESSEPLIPIDRICRVIQLVQNFRSHPAILGFPNYHFYSNTLQASADPAVMDSYIGSGILENQDFPIIFHAVSGYDDREASSPSFFNSLEALKVKEYVQMLRSDRRVQICT